MEFIKKAEYFFSQLQYCLAIDPEPIFIHNEKIYGLLLKPDIFLKIINDFQIEYPFFPENKIIELKNLIMKENINSLDAMQIIENFKNAYWFGTIIIFEPVKNKIRKVQKSINNNISEKEINLEILKYQKHLIEKRENIYNNLVNEIQVLSPPPIKISSDNAIKSKKRKISLAEYFKSHIDEKIINSIQSEFKNLYGKKLAILIYLLQTEYDLISVVTNSNTHGRKNFVIQLTNNVSVKMQSVNNYFQSGTDKLGLNIDMEKDADYLLIKEKLTKIIKK